MGILAKLFGGLSLVERILKAIARASKDIHDYRDRVAKAAKEGDLDTVYLRARKSDDRKDRWIRGS